MKHKAPTPVQKIITQTVAYARQNPIMLGIIAAAVVVVFSWQIATLRRAEILPEAQQTKAASPVIINPGDTLSWLGMEVTPVSKTISKEFKLPGRIKGAFVLDAGTKEAFKYGVKTGDVIVGVNRRSVASTKEFVKAANDARFMGGILLDIYRAGTELYVTVPFEYQYGPLAGPNKGSWQLGSPVFGQVFQYGPVVK